jgi:predicted ferric reductase
MQAGSSMIAIMVTSLPTARRHFYEAFVRTHQILALAIIAGIWIHAPRTLPMGPTIYVLVMISLWSVVRILRLILLLYRNLKNGKHLCRATIWSLPDAFQVHVKVSRPWEFRAGQYLYLSIRGVTFGSWTQSHPYFVSWWYKDERGVDVVVFIIERRKGFSATLGFHSSGNLILGRDSRGGVFEKEGHVPRLLLATDQGVAAPQPTKLGALIEGPYGQEIHPDAYGTVLLFATGIGIAGQLPYLKQFLQDFHNWDVKARKITLFWEVESERE